MPSPDVRVRLSAEGTAEVVAALRKVQSEAVKASSSTGAAATKGADGIGSLVGALGGLKGILGAAGIVLGVREVVNGIRELAVQSIETASRLGDMAESVGISASSLSVLAAEGATSGLALEQVGTVLAKTASLTTDFANGSAGAALVFKKLGVSLKDLKGKDAAQQFEIFARAVSKLKDSSEKTALVVDALGNKLGAKAIPFLNQFGEKGLRVAREEAERLGFILSDQVVANVKRLGDTAERNQSQIVALGSAFLSGAAAPIVDGLEQIQEALGTTKTFWDGLGLVIGYVVRGLILLGVALVPIQNLFEGLGTIIGNAAIQLDSFFRQASLRSRGRLAEAESQAKLVEEVVRRNLDAAAKRAQERMELAGRAIKGIFTGVTDNAGANGGGGSSVDPEELRRRRRELQAAQISQDKAFSDARFSLAQEADRREYQRGLLNLSEYYDRRRRLVAEALKAELAFIDGQRALDIAKASSSDERAQINRRAANQRDIAKRTAEGRTDDLETQRETARLNLSRNLLNTRRESLAVIDRERSIQDDLLRLEVAQKQAELESQGIGGDRLNTLLAEFSTSLELKKSFDNAVQDSDRALTDLQARRSEVQGRIQQGLVGEISGSRQLLEIDRERLPHLRELASALQAAANETGNPEFIDKAQEFALKIDAIGYSIRTATDALATFRADFENAFQSGLSTFLGDAINQVYSLEDAFRSLARSIIADIQRISAQKLSGAITQLLFGGGFGLTKSQKDLIAITSGIHFATGGYVSGPGTGTSDSIPASLSHGEFVVRAAVVDQPGVREALTNLNFGHRYDLTPPSFAPIAFDHGDFAESGGTLTVNLGEGLKAGDVESKGRLRILVKEISDNRRLFRRILGGG